MQNTENTSSSTFISSVLSKGKKALSISLTAAVLGGTAMSGCTSLQQSFEVNEQREETILDMTSCEGEIYDTGESKYTNFSYEIYEDITFHGADATKIELNVMVGGIGQTLNMYNLYGEQLDQTQSFYQQYGREGLYRRVKNMEVDVVEVETNAGPFSLPTGTYDVSQNQRIASQLYDVKPAEDREQVRQFQHLFRQAWYDAAKRKINGTCN